MWQVKNDYVTLYFVRAREISENAMQTLAQQCGEQTSQRTIISLTMNSYKDIWKIGWCFVFNRSFRVNLFAGVLHLAALWLLQFKAVCKISYLNRFLRVLEYLYPNFNFSKIGGNIKVEKNGYYSEAGSTSFLLYGVSNFKVRPGKTAVWLTGTVFQ